MFVLFHLLALAILVKRRKSKKARIPFLVVEEVSTETVQELFYVHSEERVEKYGDLSVDNREIMAMWHKCDDPKVKLEKGNLKSLLFSPTKFKNFIHMALPRVQFDGRGSAAD
jgi:hypothetical protein